MCREKQNMRNRIFHYRMNGVITVEMSYILPMVFWTFLAVIYMIFYFHDKNIMIGAAAETAVVGAQLERKPDEKDRTDLEGFYQQRIAGKLILFPETAAEAEILKKRDRYGNSRERSYGADSRTAGSDYKTGGKNS